MPKALSPFDGVTEDQRSLLLLVQKDGQYLYPSRAGFDADYKWLRRVPLVELYSAWRALNRSLVRAEPSSCLRLPLDTIPRIRHARQVLGLLTKIEGLCNVSAIPDWAVRVAQVRSFVPKDDQAFCVQLISRLLGPAPLLSDLVPCHGPGAVAGGERGIGKSEFTRMYRKWLPFGGVDLLHLNDRHWWNQPYALELLSHPITKVIEVEKDVMRRRIISEEPLEMQFLQQGVARYMMRRIERSEAHIRFTDQTPNRSLAKQWLSMSTLDMSDASDLVSRRQVWSMFPPEWRTLLFALRSHFGKTSEGLVPLRCFAPMGSALCFPVESIVFYALVSCALRRAGCNVMGRRNHVHIYGDDIIIPREYASFVMRYLSEVGFKPNVDKCCIQTPFRESCGAEYWEAEDISIIRPKSVSFSPGLPSLPMVDLANRLYKTGYESAAVAIAENYPNKIALGSGPSLGEPSLPWARPGARRWNHDYQIMEQLTLLTITRGERHSEHNEYKGLFMAFTNRWRSDMVPVPHLSVKYGWVAALP